MSRFTLAYVECEEVSRAQDTAGVAFFVYETGVLFRRRHSPHFTRAVLPLLTACGDKAADVFTAPVMDSCQVFLSFCTG